MAILGRRQCHNRPAASPVVGLHFRTGAWRRGHRVPSPPPRKDPFAKGDRPSVGRVSGAGHRAWEAHCGDRTWRRSRLATPGTWEARTVW
jgi:hypothetical protein